ncbi:MAG: 4Fe-4S dicluster domain-containing protein [Kiritimatiellaeota bacterium]|nr:4Fe-4S dicluster domain-containing protein [Kiritimatiellota bacterium]
MKRTIIRIDEEKCDGCGLCISACPEGALQLVDGKARLVSESYCDGLGACIGECPQDAITFEEREAEAFDEASVKAHMQAAHGPPPTGCPGVRAFGFAGPPPQPGPSPEARPGASSPPSELAQWPVQMRLVPVTAPYWAGADLLIAADCVPVACAGFHAELLRGRKLIIFCPKLDDTRDYIEKLAAILRENSVRSVTVAYMEVPCCGGTVRIARQALDLSGKTLPVRTVRVSIQDGALAWD